MTRMDQANAVIEFAKANGFPNARMYLWSEEGERGFDTPVNAVDDLGDGDQEEFEVCVNLCGVTLRQVVTHEGGHEYSNAIEVDS